MNEISRNRSRLRFSRAWQRVGTSGTRGFVARLKQRMCVLEYRGSMPAAVVACNAAVIAEDATDSS